MFHLLLATMLQDAAAPAAAGTVTDTYNATQVFFFSVAAAAQSRVMADDSAAQS